LGFLARTIDEMSEKLRLYIENKSKMLGFISHELNTPLACIQANTELLKDGMIDSADEQQRYFDLILGQIERLGFLINDVRELSKLETKESRFYKIQFYVYDLLEEVLQSIEFLSASHNASVKLIVDDKELMAYGDPERIFQVVQNLIKNAVLHNNPGVSINVSGKKEENSVCFTVEDNGKGIPEEEIKHICERFYKVDKARTLGKSGMGLGLAIVKEIIQSHGEDIRISSIKNSTKFWFNLPINPSHD
jgi:signal transduction histidine kinase